MSAAQRDKGAATMCSKCGREGTRGFRVNRHGAIVCMQAGVCARRRSPAATPRLDEADYAARLEAQGGGCALCGTKPKNRRLDVDHDHRTGEVRGLLCHRCNRALPTWVTRAWLWNAVLYLDDETLDAGAVVLYGRDALTSVNGERTPHGPDRAPYGPRVGGAATARPRPDDGAGGTGDGD